MSLEKTALQEPEETYFEVTITSLDELTHDVLVAEMQEEEYKRAVLAGIRMSL